MIPQVVITAFQTRFEPVPADISIPDICNGLHKVEVHPVNALEEQMQMFRLRATPATVSTPSKFGPQRTALSLERSK